MEHLKQLHLLVSIHPQLVVPKHMGESFGQKLVSVKQQMELVSQGGGDHQAGIVDQRDGLRLSQVLVLQSHVKDLQVQQGSLSKQPTLEPTGSEFVQWVRLEALTRFVI